MSLNPLIYLLVISTFLRLIESTIQNPVKFVPGVIYENETGQILYEATAPIIYQFETPDWNDFLTLKILNCNASDFPEYCSIYENFKSISNEILNAVSPSSFKTFPQETIQSTWGLKCNYLSQHFSSLRVDVSIVQKYMGFLRACSKEMILEEELNKNYSSRPYLNVFENITTIFQTEFLQNFDPNGDILVQKTSRMNFQNQILSTGFSSFISQSMRWNAAILTCKSGKIPDSIIPPTMFMESLRKLNEKVVKNGYIFVVSSEEQFLPLYYKNPIADCTFSGDKFIVRILVPIQFSNHNWQHLSAQKVPFYFNSLEAEEFISTTKEVVDLEQGSFFYESNSKRLFKASNCDVNIPGFCRLPELFDKSLVSEGTCLWSVLQREEPFQYCSVRELNVLKGFQVLPLVTRQATDTFIVTGTPLIKLVIECLELDGEVTLQNFNFPKTEGALEVRLPCFCKILISGSSIEANAPCNINSGDLLVTEIMAISNIRNA